MPDSRESRCRPLSVPKAVVQSWQPLTMVLMGDFIFITPRVPPETAHKFSVCFTFSIVHTSTLSWHRRQEFMYLGQETYRYVCWCICLVLSYFGSDQTRLEIYQRQMIVLTIYLLQITSKTFVQHKSLEQHIWDASSPRGAPCCVWYWRFLVIKFNEKIREQELDRGDLGVSI